VKVREYDVEKNALICMGLLAYAAMLLLAGTMTSAQAMDRLGSATKKEQLGKYLFFDTNLSTPSGQACAVCHGPSAARSKSQTTRSSSRRFGGAAR
jgi:cytochrome c peroxidase